MQSMLARHAGITSCRFVWSIIILGLESSTLLRKRGSHTSQNKDICSYSFIGNNADLIWQPQTSRTIKKMREMLDLTVL